MVKEWKKSAQDEIESRAHLKSPWVFLPTMHLDKQFEEVLERLPLASAKLLACNCQLDICSKVDSGDPREQSQFTRV